MSSDRVHEPVLVEEVLSGLAPESGEIMVDLTVGAGGHAAPILGRVGPQGRVIGVDRDACALEVARKVLEPFGDRVILSEGRSDTFRAILEARGVERVNGVLMDLGVSSLQVDDAGRGFSFLRDGPLDMRMTPGKGRSAMNLLVESTVEELERILREYGEEPSARRIAERLHALCRRRPPRTTLELAHFVESLHPVRQKGRSRVHPATRVFQALRIAVNDELGVLERTLPMIEAVLAPRGRLAIIAFHSLEDRIVKNFLREGKRRLAWESMTPKPIRPSADEVRRNPRARSARLRVAVRGHEEAA